MKSYSRIVLTGSNSMLGIASKKYLENYYYVYSIPHSHFDLLDYNITKKAFSDVNCEYLIHLAAHNGNIDYNKKYPYDIYFITTQIGLNCLRAVVETGIKKVVSIISSCAYPDMGNRTLYEYDFWNGEPNISVNAHGFAKRTILEFGRQINKQHGIPCVGMVVNTCYGPNDNYSLEKTKVVGSFIKKFIDAKNNDDKEVVCWGSGKARREFIYCEDVGKYVNIVLNHYDDSDYPINIGAGIDYSIKELAEIISGAVGYKGKIVWDTSRPDGQMSKLLDNRRMKSIFGNLEFTSLEEGINKTVEWYVKHYCANNQNS